MARMKQTKSTKVIENVKMSRAPENWQNLPYHIFGDIMIMVGRGSLEDLPKCRQVCQSWKMISQMNKYEKDTIRRKAESLAARIKEKEKCISSISDITTAAILVHQGMLGSIVGLFLRDVDLATVPAEHLASLASSITEYVYINNVSSCDLINILERVKCKRVYISRQILSSEETQALVQAMEYHVKLVVLGVWGDVILDISVLTQYSGEGKCTELVYRDKGHNIRLSSLLLLMLSSLLPAIFSILLSSFVWNDAARRYREKTCSRRLNWALFFSLLVKIFLRIL